MFFHLGGIFKFRVVYVLWNFGLFCYNMLVGELSGTNYFSHSEKYVENLLLWTSIINLDFLGISRPISWFSQLINITVCFFDCNFQLIPLGYCNSWFKISMFHVWVVFSCKPTALCFEKSLKCLYLILCFGGQYKAGIVKFLLDDPSIIVLVAWRWLNSCFPSS